MKKIVKLAGIGLGSMLSIEREDSGARLTFRS